MSARLGLCGNLYFIITLEYEYPHIIYLKMTNLIGFRCT